MSNQSKLRRLVSSPEYTLRQSLATLAPKFYFHRHSRQAINAGVQQPCFVLSFDCDTVHDIDVVSRVHERICDMGIRPVYAVPGELLKKGSSIYVEIHKSGSEFINHGGRRHTFFNATTHREESCFFYDQLTSDQRVEDICLGEERIQEVLGFKPTGFRTPHFGTFSRRQDLVWLHNFLGNRGYTYSSSSIPFWADKSGPKHTAANKQIIEFPVTGGYSRPLTILDTWRAFAGPNRSMTPQQYCEEVVALAGIMSKQRSGIVNIYADPSHIADEPLFYKAILELSKQLKPTTFSELVDVVV